MAGLMHSVAAAPGKILISVGLIVYLLASYFSWVLYSAEVPFTAAQDMPGKTKIALEQFAFIGQPNSAILPCIGLIHRQNLYHPGLNIDSMILIPYFLVGAYLLKISLQQKSS